jgi:hypothetical protein
VLDVAHADQPAEVAVGQPRVAQHGQFDGEIPHVLAELARVFVALEEQGECFVQVGS